MLVVSGKQVQHADAEELASTLTSLAQGTTSRPKTSSARKGAKSGARGAPKAAELFQGEVKVTADKATNSLVIVASQQDYKSLLAVIKKLCFEERVVDWPDLLAALRDNWEGRESLRQLVRTRAPAYGNDVDYVDDIAREIIEFYVESIRKHKTETGTDNNFAPGIATFEGYSAMGYVIGATPDGRLAREIISSNASPSVGRAVNGQTAAINSYLKLPHVDLPLASALDLAMPKRIGVLAQLETLIRTFLEGKGSQLTISVNDCEALRAAQKEPEKYRDLMVRVGGWQAYFVDLSRPMQDWQIRKCEQYA